MRGMSFFFYFEFKRNVKVKIGTWRTLWGVM